MEDNTPILTFDAETGEVLAPSSTQAVDPVQERKRLVREVILNAAIKSPLDIKLDEGILRIKDTPREELILGLQVIVDDAWDLKGGLPAGKEDFRDSIVHNLIPWLISKPERSCLKFPEIVHAIRESLAVKEWFGGVSFTNITKAITDYIQGDGAEAVQVARDVRDGKCRPGEISPERWQLMGAMWLENRRREEEFARSVDMQAARARLHEAIYGKPTYQSAFGPEPQEKRVQGLADDFLGKF